MQLNSDLSINIVRNTILQRFRRSRRITLVTRVFSSDFCVKMPTLILLVEQ